jgi:hypothetical protein
MSEAMARADQAFKAETGFTVSAKVAAAQNLSAGGSDVAAQLGALASAKTAAGTAAFDRALATALARGMTFDDAIKLAQAAVLQADLMTQADSTPQSMLANTPDKLAESSPAFQKALSDLLSRGYSIAEAMKRAGVLARDEATTTRADARNPNTVLAGGNSNVIAEQLEGVGDVLGLALARGVPFAQAMKRSRQIQADEQRAIAADALNPDAIFSSGRALPNYSSAAFEKALGNALARGETPEQAMTTARRVTMTRDASSIDSALATGRGVEAVLKGSGTSRIFRQVLGKALARGMTSARALDLARRAEQANAFKYALPASLAGKLSGKNIKISMLDGKAMPSWLSYNAKTREFSSLDVPDGAWPMPVMIKVGQTQYRLELADGVVQPPPSAH